MPDNFQVTELIITVAPAIALMVILFSVVLNGIYIFQLVASWWVLRHMPKPARSSVLWWKGRSSLLPISILVPAYNEETTIIESVRSLLSLNYPDFQVIVINDGSNDETLKRLKDMFYLEPSYHVYEKSVPHKRVRAIYKSPLQPNLMVVDKENGGKADALNVGINISRTPLFCAVDADSLLEPDSLLRAVQPFVEDPERVVAVGGTINLANGCYIRSGRVMSVRTPQNILALFQLVEYLRAFLLGRVAWSQFNALLIISGAFGIFRRSVAVEVGGYSQNTVGEDMEIVTKIHRHMRETGRDYRIRYLPDPVCWTEAPESLRDLGNQRKRWQRGALETFFKHKKMFCRPSYGAIGTLGFGQMFIADVAGPLVETFGYIFMPFMWFAGIIDWGFFAAYVVLVFNFGIVISVGSLWLEELKFNRYPHAKDQLLLTCVAVLENFGYRQLNNVWRVIGWVQFLRKEQSWGKMKRLGFEEL